MKNKLFDCVAAINFFYEEVALYYQYNYGLSDQGDYLELPDCVYISMFRDTIARLSDPEPMLQELKCNTADYFDVYDLDSPCGEEQKNRISPYILNQAERIWKIKNIYESNVNPGINIYMISAYIFVCEYEELLQNRFGYEEEEILILYHLLLTGEEIPEKILNDYCGMKKLNQVSESDELLKKSIRELIQSYFNQVIEVFDRDIHESWERNMGQDRSSVLFRVEKLFQGSQISIRKVIDNKSEEETEV